MMELNGKETMELLAKFSDNEQTISNKMDTVIREWHAIENDPVALFTKGETDLCPYCGGDDDLCTLCDGKCAAIKNESEEPMLFSPDTCAAIKNESEESMLFSPESTTGKCNSEEFPYFLFSTYNKLSPIVRDRSRSPRTTPIFGDDYSTGSVVADDGSVDEDDDNNRMIKQRYDTIRQYYMPMPELGFCLSCNAFHGSVTRQLCGTPKFCCDNYGDWYVYKEYEAEMDYMNRIQNEPVLDFIIPFHQSIDQLEVDRLAFEKALTA